MYINLLPSTFKLGKAGVSELMHNRHNKFFDLGLLFCSKRKKLISKKKN